MQGKVDIDITVPEKHIDAKKLGSAKDEDIPHDMAVTAATKAEEKEDLCTVVIADKIRRNIRPVTRSNKCNANFCYLGKEYMFSMKKSDSIQAMKNRIIRELLIDGFILFEGDVDIQADSCFSKSNQGRLVFQLNEGHIIPVFPRINQVTYCEDGPRAISEGYIIKVIANSNFTVLHKFTVKYQNNGDPYDVKERKEIEKKRREKAESGNREKLAALAPNYVLTAVDKVISAVIDNKTVMSVSEKKDEKDAPSIGEKKRTHGNRRNRAVMKDRKKTINTGRGDCHYSGNSKTSNVPLSACARPFLSKESPSDDIPSIPAVDGENINWERDFNRVDLTRRFSISEEKPNPNMTSAAAAVLAAEEDSGSNSRIHRNINRNNVRRGPLPDFIQLIEDLKEDQSQLLSIRISRPILPDALQLFMETFIVANCSNINTLCLNQIDFTGVSCELLARFLQCQNMRNIEVLSFMKSTLSEEQLKVILDTIMGHHLDNIQDLNFEDVHFSMANIKLLHDIIHDQVLLKIWSVHLRNVMDVYDPKMLEMIKDMFNTINSSKLL